MLEAVPALLIIDAQQGLLEGAHAVPDGTVITGRIQSLLGAARAAGTLVIYLQNDGKPGTIDEPESAGWFIHPELSPDGGELVIRKTADDGFEGTKLADVFKHHKLNRMAVAGLLSEMCVSATVRGALARQFEVVLIRDAHATYPLEDISARMVARVAEHALGDAVEIADAASVRFTSAAG